MLVAVWVSVIILVTNYVTLYISVQISHHTAHSLNLITTSCGKNVLKFYSARSKSAWCEVMTGPERRLSPTPPHRFSSPQVERCYYFLQACVETAQRKEPVDGRLVQFLLSNPTNDGGQWDMLVNLIGKVRLWRRRSNKWNNCITRVTQSVCPYSPSQKSMVSFQKNAFPSRIAQRLHAEWMTSSIIRWTWSLAATNRSWDPFWHLPRLFPCFQLREYCLRLRNMVASDATKSELSDAIDSMIEEVRLKYCTVTCDTLLFVKLLSTLSVNHSLPPRLWPVNLWLMLSSKAPLWQTWLTLVWQQLDRTMARVCALTRNSIHWTLLVTHTRVLLEQL